MIIALAVVAVFAACTVALSYMVHRAPSDTDLWPES